MPSPKVSWAQLRVGLLAIVAMTVLGVMIFLLTGSKPLFRDDVTIYTYLDDSAALAVGSPVRLSGILAGKVSKVELTGLSDPRRNIRITMEIDKKLLKQIPVDSKASLASENLLGSKFINIKRGVKPETVPPSGEVAALDTQGFDEIVQQGYNITVTAQVLLKRIDAVVAQIESGEGNLGKFLKDEELYTRLNQSVAEVQKLLKALNSTDGTFGKIINSPELYNDVRGSLKRIDGIVATVEKGEGTAGKLIKDPALYDDTHQTINEMKVLLADLNAGKGSAGRLLKDETLSRQLETTLKKLDTTIDRMNAGQGTIGQLLVNQALYDNLNGTMVEVKGLMQDFRANPKKFLRIKLGLF